VKAAVDTAAGVVVVDLESEEVLELDADIVVQPGDSEVGLPLVVAADSSGALIVAVVARRPPLVISRDAGATWHEAGHGLPAGRAVTVSPEHPDLIVFAGESRLYLSRDGGRFWQPLALELEEISAVAWLTEEDLG
jgi:hypothetical protein